MRPPLFSVGEYFAGVAVQFQLKGAPVAETALALRIGATFLVGRLGRATGTQAEREVHPRHEEISILESWRAIAEGEGA